ncbi:MAG TPA: helix-turn-helix domain-containing protein [Vitreimonas sp.]|uniref:helix-turn-helix domain-containing protein n=1 Tax=Vitreimonas sp. TaxID=3069702 RepID=UPI002D29F182|nr:helix-turn-helix domain-containing protein [Vitreimonas sp.]HYD86793.1 helix-turn-helix domain-containing protein [Vitreimonas sp.]
MQYARASTERELWPIPEFCRAFGRSKTFVYDALAAGDLDGVKVGRSTLITAESVKRWRDSLPKFEPGKPLQCGAAAA